MALQHISLDQITQPHLQALIDARAAENRAIEYKQQSYGDADRDRTEFLADISSFANTSGGDIVLGITAKDGIPLSFSPLSVSIDAEILRLEQIARGGLQPRIVNIGFHPIPVASGHVLIVRVSRSFSSPHRVIRQGSNRFWARSAAGKYEPDVDELRTLFLAAPQLTERIQNFRLDRIAKIVGGDAPVRHRDNGILVMHFVPLAAFNAPLSIPLQQLHRDFQIFSPIGSRTSSGSRVNFDGVIKLSNADELAAQHRAYVQLFNSGVVEAVNSSIKTSQHPIIRYGEDELVADAMRFVRDLARIGAQFPIALMVSMLGVKDHVLNLSRDSRYQWDDDFGKPFDRDQYHFREVIFESVPDTPKDGATVLRPILDQIANAAGQAASPSFDKDGNYIPLRT